MERAFGESRPAATCRFQEASGTVLMSIPRGTGAPELSEVAPGVGVKVVRGRNVTRGGGVLCDAADVGKGTTRGEGAGQLVAPPAARPDAHHVAKAAGTP